MTRIITVSGKAGHGKDTFASALSNTLQAMGYNVLIFHYADLLKMYCEKYFGWNGEKDEAGRTLLQYIGTDVIRKKRPNYWVDHAIDLLQVLKDRWDYCIIPDARFPNEMERWTKAGFKLTAVHVNRVGYESNLSAAQQRHKSETALDDFYFSFYINIEENGMGEAVNTFIEHYKIGDKNA